jgi:thiamine biosynthesis lipoprotein
MRPLFACAWDLRQATGGLFEPRVAALVRLWGFDDIARLRSAPPSAAEIEQRLADLRAAPPYDGSGHYGPAPGIGWDFGGIAKGYVVDLALQELERLGFTDATVDAGGNLAVRGARPERPWHIGIRKPLAPHEDIDAPSLLAALDARDEAVNTHGDDQRFFIHEGRRYAHILHPATGRPVHGLRSLTVVHRDGAMAEAGGAALFVAGPQQWPGLAAQLGLAQLMAVDDDGRVTATPALATRLQPQPGVHIDVLS